FPRDYTIKTTQGNRIDRVPYPCQTIEGVGSGRFPRRTPSRAPVAQLDRALAYEARGRVFESPRAYQTPWIPRRDKFLCSQDHRPTWLSEAKINTVHLARVFIWTCAKLR